MRRALLSLGLCAGACAGACGSGASEGPPTGSPLPGGEPAAAVHLEWVDVTAGSGVDFVHSTGGSGEKYLPECLGSGVALFDYDSDGALDLFLVNGSRLGGHSRAEGESTPARLYRGNGDLSFRDVSAEAGAALELYGMGAAAGDYDGDGDPDLYVTALGENALLENGRGNAGGRRFRERAGELGVAGGSWEDRSGEAHPEWSTAAAWADFDRDGDLDLFCANYVEWTPASEIFTTLDGTTKAFTTPDHYPGLGCRLFENQDGAGFRDVSREAGVAGERAKALGLAVWDFDENGWLDVVVANDTRPNMLFMGEGEGRFREAGIELGIAYDESGRARAGMGLDVAELAGVAAVAIGNFGMEPLSLYRYERGPAGAFEGGRFVSAAGRAGLVRATTVPLTFGLAFEDVDLDGRIDLLVANGHIEPTIGVVFPEQSYEQAPQLFLGQGDGRFWNASGAAGEDFQVRRAARGLALGDLDGDGDLDLVLTANGGAPAVFENRRLETSGRAHWLRVRLADPSAKNPRGIGARLELETEAGVQVRSIHTGSSYLSQSSLDATFGLGEEDSARSLRVRWPDGSWQEVPGPLPADRLMTVERDLSPGEPRK